MMGNLNKGVELPSHWLTSKPARNPVYHRTKIAVATWMIGKANTSLGEVLPNFLPAPQGLLTSVTGGRHDLPEIEKLLAQFNGRCLSKALFFGLIVKEVGTLPGNIA